MDNSLLFSAERERFVNSATLHQWGGTSAINSWLKAQKLHGIQAGRQISHNINF